MTIIQPEQSPALISPETLDTAQKVFLHLQPYFNPLAEEFWGVYLTHQLELIQTVMIHRGTLNYCKVHPRDLFREAVHLNSYGVIIAHNHTSHNAEPSLQDIKLTKKLIKCGMMLEVPILDHLIFTRSKYFSFSEAKIL